MEEFSMPQSILQIVSEKGFDGLREIMQMLFNEAMKMERENYLHASPYQRTNLRTDHANGFKPRTINMLQGEIQQSIPQTRNGDFYPSALKKGYAASVRSMLLCRKCTFTVLRPARSRQSWKRCAVLRSLPCRSAVRQKCWMPSSKNGGNIHCRSLSNICCWTPGTKKSVARIMRCWTVPC